MASSSHLPELSTKLTKTLELCDLVLNHPINPDFELNLTKSRESRKLVWQQFVDDMTHKCSRVDLTFEEKEEELREFYVDLERKLHINK